MNIRGPLTPEFEDGTTTLEEQESFLTELQANQLSLVRSVPDAKLPDMLVSGVKIFAVYLDVFPSFVYLFKRR